MGVRSVPSQNGKGHQDESAEVRTVELFDNFSSAVDVILQVDQVCHLPHSLRAMNAWHGEHFRASMQTDGFNYIRGLVADTLRETTPYNGEDISWLFEDTTHGHGVCRETVQVCSVDGRHRSAALKGSVRCMRHIRGNPSISVSQFKHRGSVLSNRSPHSSVWAFG